MFEKDVERLLNSVGIKEVKIEYPTKREFGDYAFPCFDLAKNQKRNPAEIAKEIQRELIIPKNSVIQRAEAVGPYINFFLDWNKATKHIIDSITKKSKTNKRIMVEYSAPNPVHPMHIGHSRGTFLGESICNIFEYLGWKVVRANYINDVGLQVAKLVTAYMKWGEKKKPEGKPDFWLWQYYVKFHDEAKVNPTIEDEAREVLRQFEFATSKKISAIWNRVVKWCVDGFEETYKNLGINFDVYFFENEFRKPGKKIVEQAIKKKIAFKSPEGTIVGDLEKFGIPNFVLLRSDGTGLYQTSDLGLAVHKIEKYKLDKSIYVVSSQQDLHFKQLFKMFELLKFGWSKNLYHASFEHVVLPEGKMSSREGRAIMLDDVIKKLIDKAKQEVKKRNPKLNPKETDEIARRIGIGAIKYAIVRLEPTNSITFDWDKMLSFEGNTGPYIQYAHTRCNSILKKAGKWKRIFSAKQMKEEEKNLVSMLGKFNKTIEDASENLKPYYICNYLYDLTAVLNNFYEKCNVLKAENEQIRNFRLTLVDSTREVLERGMRIVGMEAPKRM